MKHSRLWIWLAMAACLSSAVGNVRAKEKADGKRPGDLLNQMWSSGQAAGSGPVRLKNFPLRIEDIGYIIPMGMMASGHVTPSAHLYLVPKESKAWRSPRCCPIRD